MSHTPALHGKTLAFGAMDSRLASGIFQNPGFGITWLPPGQSAPVGHGLHEMEGLYTVSCRYEVGGHSIHLSAVVVNSDFCIVKPGRQNSSLYSPVPFRTQPPWIGSLGLGHDRLDGLLPRTKFLVQENQRHKTCHLRKQHPEDSQRTRVKTLEK